MSKDGVIDSPPQSLTLTLSQDAFEAIAQRAADTIMERQREEPAPRWLYGAKEAAAYLGWPVKRVHNRITDLPHHRNGNRLMFRTDELDRVVREGV